jgi:hypothetical protein
MNAKKVKSIRKSLRKAGVDIREASYKLVGVSRFFLGHVTLESTCGRHNYKWVKKNAL